eukprot:4501312-Heterocapsa_arctica.AAC.1
MEKDKKRKYEAAADSAAQKEQQSPLKRKPAAANKDQQSPVKRKPAAAKTEQQPPVKRKPAVVETEEELEEKEIKDLLRMGWLSEIDASRLRRPSARG